jgi:anti-sigma regulatory factor (Ser/Thr protein kinase)
VVTSSEHDDLRRGPVTAERHLYLALPADPGAPAAARARISAWLSACGWPPAPQEDLVLALSEAVSNAVEHGYGVRPGVVAPPGVVEVAAEVLAEGRVEIIVRDRGGWRSPSQLRSHRRHGIPIMRACVAECVIDGTPFGTTVVLRSHPLAG